MKRIIVIALAFIFCFALFSDITTFFRYKGTDVADKSGVYYDAATRTFKNDNGVMVADSIYLRAITVTDSGFIDTLTYTTGNGTDLNLSDDLFVNDSVYIGVELFVNENGDKDNLVITGGTLGVTGFYWTGASMYYCYNNSSTVVKFSDDIESITNGGFFIEVGSASSATSPVFCPNENYHDDGLGSDGDSKPCMVSNGKQVAQFATATNAVNYHTFYPSATGDSIRWVADGTDSNIDISIEPKGTGSVYVQSDIIQLGENALNDVIVFCDSDSLYFVNATNTTKSIAIAWETKSRLDKK